jgi:hypothetical protein
MDLSPVASKHSRPLTTDENKIKKIASGKMAGGEHWASRFV